MRKVFLVALMALAPFTISAAEKKGKEGPPITMDATLDRSEKQRDIDRSMEVFKVYMEGCLYRYGAGGDLEQWLAGEGFKAMTPDAVQARMGEGTGRGWVLGRATAKSRIELIWQENPSLSCSVFAFDGFAGNYDMMAQFGISAMGTDPKLDISVFEPPKRDLPATMRLRSYLLKSLDDDGKEIDGAEVGMLVVVVDNAPNAPYRVRYERITP